MSDDPIKEISPTSGIFELDGSNGTGYTLRSKETEPVFALIPALSPTSINSPEASE